MSALSTLKWELNNMKYIKELKEMAERNGLQFTGVDAEGEMEFIGDKKQWQAFQDEYDNLESK